MTVKKKTVKEKTQEIERKAVHDTIIDMLNKQGGDVSLDLFCEIFDALSMMIHTTAKDKGWWDSKRSDGECVALMHSELSEALEAMRHGNPMSDHIPEFTGVEEELADVIIRIMDFAHAKNMNVAAAVITKMGFNQNRPKMHGGKKF